MINLTINAHDGHLYEITSRYNQPQASAARTHRADAFTTQSLIARLSIEPDTWVQILARVNNRPTALRSYHAGAVHQEVAQAVMRGDLNLYQLPLLNSARCLRGKKDTGLCIIQGPKPHSATELSPVAISTPQAAQAMLDELGITASALLAYLDSNGIYNSYDQNKPLDEVLNRLASQKLLAYKIPLPPASAPKKSVEYIPAAGPGYDAVPLAPESRNTEKKSSVIAQKKDDETATPIAGDGEKASFNEFCSTVEEFEDKNEISKQAYDLYLNENWQELEQLFNDNKLNGGWPPNRGAISTTEITLPVGTKIDRYGGFVDKDTGQFRDLGTFVSYEGEPFENRALPLETKSKTLKSYEVVKPIPKVNAGKAIPWFNQSGLGTQLETPLSIENLLAKGYLKEI